MGFQNIPITSSGPFFFRLSRCLSTVRESYPFFLLFVLSNFIEKLTVLFLYFIKSELCLASIKIGPCISKSSGSRSLVTSLEKSISWSLWDLTVSLQKWLFCYSTSNLKRLLFKKTMTTSKKTDGQSGNALLYLVCKFAARWPFVGEEPWQEAQVDISTQVRTRSTHKTAPSWSQKIAA